MKMIAAYESGAYYAKPTIREARLYETKQVHIHSHDTGPCGMYGNTRNQTGSASDR
jgi:hypothetical protein